ncbi:MAG: hypothetical protein ABR915_08200 [Thermoguttaceae bacterium]
MTQHVHARLWGAVGLGMLLLAGSGGCALVQEFCAELKCTRSNADPCTSCCYCGCCKCCAESSGGECGCGCGPSGGEPRGARSNAEGRTAPAPLPRPTEALPLPPKPPKRGLQDDGMPWPGEMPAPPKKTGESPSDSGPTLHSADVRATTCLDQSGAAVLRASGSSSIESGQPPGLLGNMATYAPLDPAGSPVSSDDSDPAAEPRIVIHEDPSSGDSHRPTSNPLR